MPDMKARLNLLTDEVQRGLLYYGVAIPIREQVEAPEFNRALPHTLGFATAVATEGACTLYDTGIMTDDSWCDETASGEGKTEYVEDFEPTLSARNPPNRIESPFPPSGKQAA